MSPTFQTHMPRGWCCCSWNTFPIPILLLLDRQSDSEVTVDSSWAVNNNVSNCVRSILVLSAHKLGNCNLQHGGVGCDWTGSRSKEGEFLIKKSRTIVTLWNNNLIIKESLKKKESIRTGANFKVGFDGDSQKNGQRDISVGTSAKVWNWEQDGRCSTNRGDRGKMMFFIQMVVLMMTAIATMVKLKNRY